VVMVVCRVPNRTRVCNSHNASELRLPIDSFAGALFDRRKRVINLAVSNLASRFYSASLRSSSVYAHKSIIRSKQF